jgi:hypothetical protein
MFAGEDRPFQPDGQSDFDSRLGSAISSWTPLRFANKGLTTCSDNMFRQHVLTTWNEHYDRRIMLADGASGEVYGLVPVILANWVGADSV